MDPETAEMSGEEFTVGEFDMDFEYDAPRFYDFSRPELDSEKEYAELWFESSGTYPPSAFSLMSNWRNDFIKQFTSNNGGDYWTGEVPHPSIKSLDVCLDCEDKYNGFIYNGTVNDVPSTAAKFKSKSTLSRSSTLTRPTASLLARQNKPIDAYSAQLLRRCQRSLGKVDDKISSVLCSMVQHQDTKRQKLEAGYLRKVSRLDQTPFVHKVQGKLARVNSNSGRSKVTVPREPNLQTAKRAGRHHQPKVSSEPEKNVKLNSDSSKRRPTNKNVLESCLTSLPKRNTPRPPDLQALHLRTSLRAMQRSSNSENAPTDDSMRENEAHSRSLKSHGSSKDRKFNRICSSKTNPKDNGSKVSPIYPKTSNREELGEAMDVEHENSFPREFEDPTDTSFRDDPAIESFSKLCLNSDSDINTGTPSTAHKPVRDIDRVIKRLEGCHGN